MIPQLKFHHVYFKQRNLGPWWRSSGQGARLLLLRSEFDPAEAHSFFCKMCVWKEQK